MCKSLRARLPGFFATHSRGRMSGGEGNSISSNKKEKETIFFTLSLVSRRMGPFLPHQKKIMGSIPHEFRIFPDGCLCSGDLGMGCPHDQACSPQLPAEWPGQSSLCQVLHVVKSPRNSKQVLALLMSSASLF